MPGNVRSFGCLTETFIGSISVFDGRGKEVVLNVKTGYRNNKTFFTDSMGLEEQRRVLDFRPTWNYTVYEPVAGNYYSINSFIRIEDVSSNRSVAVLNDRSQGGSVLNDGDIEIMIHRRLLVDDLRGVNEALDERENGMGLTQLVRHRIVWGK